MAARSGSSNSHQHHILLGSVSKERGPGSNSLWPAKTGRRLTNSEVMEYEANREEDEVIQESPNMKCGSIWK